MRRLPLAGIRVLEIGGYISVPFATMILAGLGAEVVKVERPGSGDEMRRGLGNRSPYFAQYNAGKRSLAVDLKTPDGVSLIRELLPTFDVVVENMRAGKLESLGLGPDDCRAHNTNLIYVSVTGFGNGGPLVSRPAYDTIGQAYGGMLSILGDPGVAQLAGTCLADLITGVATATGVLAALVGRGTPGWTAARVETSILESLSLLTVDALTQYCEDGGANPTRQSRHPQAQGFALTSSTGDALIVHLSSSQKFWLRCLDVVERPDLATDARFATYHDRVRNYFELLGILQTEFGTRPAVEWESRLIEADVPFAPILTLDRYLQHPQTKWLDLLEPEDDGLTLLRAPWRFDGERPHREKHTPTVGEHTGDIAGEVYTSERVQSLSELGVLFSDLAGSKL